MDCLTFRSSWRWMVFWACFPVAAIIGLFYIMVMGGEPGFGALLIPPVLLVAVGVNYSSKYVEFRCTPTSITIEKPYNLLPVFRHYEVSLAELGGVSMWNTRGNSFNFFQRGSGRWFIDSTRLFYVDFMSVDNDSLQAFADYLHQHAVATSGF